MVESDLGNVGVQRQVRGYEKVTLGNRTKWLAVLSCGHEVKIDEPPDGVGPAGPGRYRDCPSCEAAG